MEVDKRIFKSKKYLKEALLSFLENNSLSDIKVSRLCEAAQINRTTFYAHYDKVKDLYDDVVNEFMEHICDHLYLVCLYQKTNEIDNVINNFIKYVDDNSRLFVLIFTNSNNIDASMVSYNSFKEKMKSTFHLNDKDIEYLTNFYIYAGGSILYTWILRKKKETYQTLIEIMKKLLSKGASSYEK